MYVCMYVCLYVCYATSPDALYLARQIFTGSPMTTWSYMNHTYEPCGHNYMSHADHTLRQQLRTIVDSVTRLFFDCPKLRHTSLRHTSQFQEPTNLLADSIMYESIDGYLCDYPDI